MNRGIAKRHTKADKKAVCKTKEPAFAAASFGTTSLLSRHKAAYGAVIADQPYSRTLL